MAFTVDVSIGVGVTCGGASADATRLPCTCPPSPSSVIFMSSHASAAPLANSVIAASAERDVGFMGRLPRK
ncbi:MAG: hypothetical protein IPM22_17790 [Betaproteobacteria bacterium]|nr:hypothetical protein [Betaproteobacteria bacterium]